MKITVSKLVNKVKSILNRYSVFWEKKSDIELIICGFTRSGTTFFSQLISRVLKARYIHEPLSPQIIKSVLPDFHERESCNTIRKSARHRMAIQEVLGPQFNINKYSEVSGGGLIYSGRIVKLVRANFYAGELAKLFPDVKFSVIIRHPCACISSRIELGWDVPDHSKCIFDIYPKLTKDQMRIVDEADLLHKKLAVSWCLDNIMLLSNQSNPSFKFFYYENLALNTTKEIVKILEFMGKDSQQYGNRIDREIRRQKGKVSDPEAIIFKWQKKLNQTSIDEIMYIVDTFGLSYLYEKEIAYPKHAFI